MINYGSLYKIYSEKYDKAYKQAKAKGLPIFDKIEKANFKFMFESVKNTMKDSGIQNPKDTQVVKKMIERDKYGTTTEAQGRAIYQALRAKGIEMDISTIRSYYEYVSADLGDWNDLPNYIKNAGQPLKEFFDEIKEFYAIKRAQGFDASVIKGMIAQIYFGSP